jgi:hypothetical protein
MSHAGLRETNWKRSDGASANKTAALLALACKEPGSGFALSSTGIRHLAFQPCRPRGGGTFLRLLNSLDTSCTAEFTLRSRPT